MAVAQETSAKAVKVADIFLIEEGERIVDVEIAFSEAITAPQGAVHTIDLLRNALNSSGWITKAVMSANRGVSDQAPVPSNEQTTKDGDAEKNKSGKN